MLSLFFWYLSVSLLGLLVFPLAYRLLPALADRGYALSRPLGLLLWGFVFWLLASLGILQNDIGGLLFALAIVAAFSAWALYKTTDHGSQTEERPSIVHGLSSIASWFKSNWKTVLTTELIFLAAFALMALVRAANPEALGTEKPMELAFINAILKSPTFPPHDPWLSGYAISYYYFGYVIAAMLAKLTGTIGAVAFNLMIATLFGLNAAGAFGVGYDLLIAYFDRRPQTADGETPSSTVHRPSSNILGALLSPLFLLIFSNLEGFLEILHRIGLFWSADRTTSAFWTWLGIQNLNEPPPATPGILPDRFWWWWRTSRVIHDYDLAGNFHEVIDEMPAFSYVLGDLHPHVLAMPFALLAIGTALNIFLGGWQGETNILGWLKPRIRLEGFLFAALLLGGMAFLNTWDFPIYLALIGGAYLLALIYAEGWNWGRLLDFFELVVPLAVASVLLYLPFFAGFSSQAGGILPNLIFPTRGAQFWVMFAPQLIFLFAFFLFLWRAKKLPSDWKSGLLLALGLGIALWLFSWLMALVALRIAPGDVRGLMESQGTPDIASLFSAATTRRLSYIGGLVTMFLILGGALAFITHWVKSEHLPENNTPVLFVLLLVVLGALLVIAPEFVYLRDQFGYRMNTIFKFYYQAWLLWSMAAAFGVVVMLHELRGVWQAVFSGVFVLVAGMALVFSPMAFAAKTNNFNPPGGFSLDASRQLAQYAPDDALAVAWLKTAQPGVIAEAVGGQYSEYARIATNSGLQNVIGWPGHESQWGRDGGMLAQRETDVKTLYETRNWEEAKNIIDQYGIKYIYVGDLERRKYERLNVEKFQQFLPVIYQQGGVTIYFVP